MIVWLLVNSVYIFLAGGQDFVWFCVFSYRYIFYCVTTESVTCVVFELCHFYGKKKSLIILQ